MKKLIWIGLLFFLSGIFVTVIIGDELLTNYGFLNEYHLKSFAHTSFPCVDLAWNTIWERGKCMLILSLVCATPIRSVIPKMLSALCGFVIGVFATVCVVQLGGWGLVFLVAALFPHGMLYVIVVALIYALRPTYQYDGKRKNSKLFLQIILIIILFLSACLIETMLGTKLLQMVLCKIY